MNVFSFFSLAVFAAETIISPIPAGSITLSTSVSKPSQSFAQIVHHEPSLEVLGVAIEEPSPVSKQTRKNHYTVAVLGDSMVDTMGPGVPALESQLKTLFPSTSFTILNYGVGGTNIDYGLERLTSDYTYLGNAIPSLVSQQPDIVVVESFGYNPYSYDEGALDRHWLAMASIVDRLKTYLPGVKIVIAATIAPNSRLFGDGAPGQYFDAIAKVQKTTTIKAYLENTVAFAKGERLPLADAYHPSLDGSGDGKEIYINPGDHIHYSDAGRQFFANVVANAIASHKLLE